MNNSNEQSKKLVLGIDVGSNSIGWSLVNEQDGAVFEIVDMGVRIFNKSVEDKTPTPKNVSRRNARLARRVIQRRARRKLKMRNYLISMNLLPTNLKENPNPEQVLNDIGNPYELRVKGLDEKLNPYEFGRILLHFVARRGFLSAKKQLAGDLADDPDVLAYINETQNSHSSIKDDKQKEEEGFLKDVSDLRNEIETSGYRTLAEYLFNSKELPYFRNRSHTSVNKIIRTDRQMYKDELALIWQNQKNHFANLPADFYESITKTIFYQRPLRLAEDRVGKCSLEPKNQRARMARLQAQEFRYLQVINNLEYFDKQQEKWLKLGDDTKKNLAKKLETHPSLKLTQIKKEIGIKNNVKLNIDSQIQGNITANKLIGILGLEVWNEFSTDKREDLLEDLLSIKKKSALKRRLENHWQFSADKAIELCLVEFEPSFSSLSLKAINKLLPYLRQGMLYSDARINAGYGYEIEKSENLDKLLAPPVTSNPIVNKAMSEIRRVVNAIIKKYGKPSAIRVEMARDLEMSTKRYKENERLQKANEKANERAAAEYQSATGKQYPKRDDKLKHRLWLDQEKLCAYSGKTIGITELFTSAIEVDHILPYKKSLDDSYMNKVVCLANENRYKSDKTPIDAYSGDAEKWNQITQRISHWNKNLSNKSDRFFIREEELQKRDFISTQLNDTRYISKLSLTYLASIGSKISTTKGQITAWLRHQWGLNSLISEKSNQEKDRTDHRHHAVDALVVACVSPGLHQGIKNWTQNNIKDLVLPPPFKDFREHAAEYLKHIIVAHDVKRKLSGSLHEETGLGMLEVKQDFVRPVARVSLNQITNFKQLSNIVDERVKEHLREYVENECDGNYKLAFDSNQTVYHLDGKTPIHKLRVFKSQAVEKEDFFNNKLVIKDQKGKAFKFYTYGNTHHLEIFKHTETGKIEGRFVTNSEANQRVKGIKTKKQNIVNTSYKDGCELLMVLYINDLVSVVKEDNNLQSPIREFYRVQKFQSNTNGVWFRNHLAANLENKEQVLYLGISELNFKKYDLKKHSFNVLGDLIEKE